MNEKEIYERLKYCLENDAKISRSLLTNYIYLLLDKYELEEYVDKIALYYKDINVYGFYNNINKQLFINYDKYVKSENNKLFNLKLLETTFHELTHICQIKILNNPDELDEIFQTYFLNFKLTYEIPINDLNFYNTNYENLIFENQAIINAIFKLDELIDKLNIEDKKEYINRILSKAILKVYKKNSPIEKSLNLLKKYRKISLDNNIPDVDIYYKLIFGYPIDDDSLDIIKDISKSKIKTKNLLNKIKKEN